MCFAFVLGNTKAVGKISNPVFSKIATIDFGNLAATNNKIFKKTFPVSIIGIRYQSTTTQAANDTNFITIGIINKSTDGTGVNVVVDNTLAVNSTKATGGVNANAFVANKATVITTGSVNILAANESLSITVTVGGTINLANLVLFVDYVDA